MGFGTFTGGIDLSDQKQRTLSAPIEPFRPSRLLVPLSTAGGPPASPLVDIGDRVAAGQIIAAGPQGGVDVFAPLRGEVKGLSTAMVAGEDGFIRVGAIELADLGEAESLDPVAPSFDWRVADADEIIRRIGRAGLVACRMPCPNLAAMVDEARAHHCRIVIANVMEGQPYVTAAHRLLAEHGPETIRGLALIARAIGADDVTISVDRRRTEDYRDLITPARRYGVQRVALEHKYPIGSDVMLAYVLTRRRTPPGGRTTDVGVVVVDVATCFAAYRAVACGVVQRGRVVTVSGERASRVGNFWVAFGTPCSELLKATGPGLLHGGPMTGLPLLPTDAVVTAATDALLAIEPVPHVTPTQCIRCGWCVEHCPARLNVSALNDAYELGDLEQARKLAATASLGCGVCSYVCPARLPLAQRVKTLRRMLRQQDATGPMAEAK